MKNLIGLTFLLALPVMAQVSNPSIVTVSADPSGSTACSLPWRYSLASGTGWYPGSPSGGSCTWTQIGSGGGGSGTVTSVTFTGDGIIDSATPSTAVTTAGTVTATPITQTANTVLAGPSSGSAANPTFRALVNADFANSLAPTISAANMTAFPTSATTYPGAGVPLSTGSGWGTSYSIGTSGAVIPLLSTANTWTLGQTFSALAQFSLGANIASGQVLSWNSDTGFSRSAAGTIFVGNGTNGSVSGVMEGAQFIANGSGVNSAGFSSAGFSLGTGKIFGFSSTTAFNGALDTTICRNAAGIVEVGTSTTCNANGTVNAAAYQVGGAATFPVVRGTLTMTTAASDVATVTGATSSSVCAFAPTNSTAAASSTVLAFISAVAANAVTISHAATVASGGTLNVICTIN